MLLSEAGLRNEDLQKVVIAGAFGSSMNLGSAISLGLLPVANTSIYQNIGNAAGSGARLMLLSTKQRILAEEISRRVHYVELQQMQSFHLNLPDLWNLQVLALSHKFLNATQTRGNGNSNS